MTVNSVSPNSHGNVPFYVTNTGGSSLSWTLSEPTAVSWLSCTAVGGGVTSPAGLGNSETDLVTCTVDTTGLPIGFSTGIVRFTDANAVPVFEDVTFNVNVTVAPAPKLQIDSSNANVSTTFGTDYSTTGSFDVCNIGNAPMICTIQDSIDCYAESCSDYQGPSWIQYDQAEWTPTEANPFNVAAGACTTITTSYVGSRDCQLGGNTVTVQVACSHLPAQYFPITLTVTEP